MKNLLKYIFGAFALAVVSSCVKTPVEPGLSEGEGWLVLDYGASVGLQVETKATLEYANENNLLNFYLFVFDSQGKKIYGKWFDSSMLKASDDAVTSANEDCWSKTQGIKKTDSSGTVTEKTQTHGRIKIKTKNGENYTIYALSNVNADMVRISSEYLSSSVDDISDIQNLVITLSQDVVSRNGYFPMCGKLRPVNVSGGTMSTSGKLVFTRLDAKISFDFQIGTAPEDKQQVESFKIEKWRVVNVPRKTYLASYADRGASNALGNIAQAAGQSSDDFFSTTFVNPNYSSTSGGGFSFYMLENCRDPKGTGTGFHDRDKQVKDAAGLNTVNPDGTLAFVYADDLSTYVEVKGWLTMKLVGDSAGQILNAEVVYRIHLGNFENGSFGDFNVERNHSYKYTITIYGVDNIRAEVSRDIESEPATGGVVSIARETIALCDAHYVTKTLTFHAKYLVQPDENGIPSYENMTWRVKTPFCDGQPLIAASGAEIITDDCRDYKWVMFALNEKQASGSYYEEKRRSWADAKTKGELMDISQLVAYMRQEADKYYNGTPNDFDNGKLSDGSSDPLGAKICLTAFVDEYYYDADPITGIKWDGVADYEDRWKTFVNQDNRVMSILCNSQISTDRESRMTGSVVTITQNSIQTVYNTDESKTDLKTAWGMEHRDEYAHLFAYNEYNTSSYYERSLGNTDKSNGRYNSIKEWGLPSNPGTEDWSEYLDEKVENDLPMLATDKYYLRYSCLARNRDLDGDGKIDRNEIRWYTASIRQLVGIWLGADVISSDARLYTRTAEERTRNEGNTVAKIKMSNGVEVVDVENTEFDWHQHIISSTAYINSDDTYNSNNPTILWAEQGCTTGTLSYSMENAGAYSQHPYDGTDLFSVRCVRNLGLPNDSASDAKPQDLIMVTPSQSGDGSYTFDASNINPSSLRPFVNTKVNGLDLDDHDEMSEANRLYLNFTAAGPADAVNAANAVNGGAQEINKQVTITGTSSGVYCPVGYRLPNQREAVVMLYYVGSPSSFFSGDTMTRTYFSFGSVPDDLIKDGYLSSRRNPKLLDHANLYRVNAEQIFLPEDKGVAANSIRCVRDNPQ